MFRTRQDRLNGSASGVSDETLVAEAVVLGDAAAFEVLVRRHERRIYYLQRRFTGNPAIAEELCQETFLRAWRKLASFEGRGAFNGWLTRLAYNVFLQHRRKSRNRADSEPREPSGAHDVAGPRAEGPAGHDSDLEKLLSVVGAEEQRLLVLSYAGGLSAREIGELLGTSPGTVKSQIHRAKQKIRRHFHIETPT